MKHFHKAVSRKKKRETKKVTVICYLNQNLTVLLLLKPKKFTVITSLSEQSPPCVSVVTVGPSNVKELKSSRK